MNISTGPKTYYPGMRPPTAAAPQSAPPNFLGIRTGPKTYYPGMGPAAKPVTSPSAPPTAQSPASNPMLASVLQNLQSRQSLQPSAPAGVYSAPSRGQIGPGGASFNSSFGARNGNRADINTWGSGLWSAGFDPARYNQGPESQKALYAQLQDYQNKNKVNLEGYYKNAPNERNAPQGYLNAMDWYFRDQARKQDKAPNSFLSTIPGQLLTLAATGGAGILGGPALAGLVGAGFGGATGGVKGALLGGAGGYLGGKFLPSFPKPIQTAAKYAGIGNALIPANRG